MEKKYEYSGPNSVFEFAIDKLEDVNNDVFGPLPFIDYLDGLGFPKLRAPDSISIDSYERLQKTLKSNDCMVLRLGRSTSIGTQFAIVKSTGNLRDFFLFDKEIFLSDTVEYIPKINNKQLLAYKLLPTLTENSMVNLGFASGLISEALQLDEITPIYPPATCSSTFTFDFKPHSTIDKVVHHNKGQVEIDAVFVETRNGVDTLFVVEAKVGNTHKSLAKHKLLYPVLGIAPNVPLKMPIVPVYLKVLSSPEGIHFHIAECEVPDPRKALISYDELKVSRGIHYIYPKHLLK